MNIYFRKKTRYSYANASGSLNQLPDLSSLNYVPIDSFDEEYWLIPDRKIKTDLGIEASEVKVNNLYGNTAVFSGDIIAKAPNAIIFTAND